MNKIFLPVSFPLLTMSLSAQLVINEVLYDPALSNSDPSVGDANGDGTRDSTQDEFVELVNTSGAPLDITGWTVSDRQGTVHTFGATTIADGQAVVIFGGGTPTGNFGGALAVAANGNWGGLGNGGDDVSVSDSQLMQVAFFTYVSGAAGGESLVLSTELDDASGYVAHSTVSNSGGSAFSPGTRVGGAPFGDADLLFVEVTPISFSEGAGATAAIGTVTRTGDTAAAVTVSLLSSDVSEAAVPATVTIAAGMESSTFDVTAVNDSDQDGDQSVTISASAPDLFTGTTLITVEDDEAPIPTMTLSINQASISENGGTATATLEISLGSPTGYTFNILSSDRSELSAPATVTIPANETTGTFLITGVDDFVSDGTAIVTVTVSDPNAIITDASAVVNVLDDEVFVFPDIKINEIRIDNFDIDTDEFIELYSEAPDVNLDRVTLIVLGDGATSLGSGVVEKVFPFDGLSFSGNYFVAASDTFSLSVPDITVGSDIFENSDNLTFLLVTDFTGSVGTDLDDNDDGELNPSPPWGLILDGVSVLESAENPPVGTEYAYAASLGFPSVGPVDGFIAPGYVYRSPSEPFSWLVGPFQAFEGDPNADPPIPPVEIFDSPGVENTESGVPNVETISIRGFIQDQASGRGEIIATGLGTKSWVVQESDDLGVTDSWTTFSGGFAEVDNADGSTSFVFFDSFSSQVKRFYRLAEAP